MASLIKEVLVLIIVIFAVMPISYGLSVTCNPSSPLTVTVGGSYTATVEHSGASQVGYGSSVASAVWQSGSSYTFDVTAPTSEQTKTYYGMAYDSSGNLISDSNVKCVVTASCSGTANTPSSVSISASPSSVSSGGTTTITVSGNDAEGLSFIQYYDGIDYHTYSCNGAKVCSNSWPGIIINSQKTFTGYAQDLCGVQAPPPPPPVTVTVTNSPPSFITTSPLPAATAGQTQAYTTTIQASDTDGDTVVYDLDGEPSGMSIDQSGRLTWNSPDSTKTVTVKIYDIDVNNKPLHSPYPEDFTLPVSQCTADVFCPLQQGVCAGSKRTCSNGQLSPASCSLVYAAISNYQSPETSCDGKDNNCNGQIDEGACVCIDNDKDKYNATGGANCGPPDCKDDNKDIHPGAVEKCDGVDSNCNGIDDADEETSDGKPLCDCNWMKSYLKVPDIFIKEPKNNANKTVQAQVPFISSTNAEISSYAWDFGDGSKDEGPSVAHAYSSKGSYDVKLSYYFSQCSFLTSIKINILGCTVDNDCSANQECRSGVCEAEQIIIPNATANITLPSVQASINIISPKNNQVFTDSKILLVYSTTPANTQCSYSLNNDPSYITLQSNQVDITAKEGQNTLKMMCRGTIASLNFIVTPKAKSIFDEMKGENKGDSIFSTIKDQGVEQTLSKQDAEKLVVDVIQNYNFSVTKLAERQGNSSLLMFNVKNIMPITINFLDLIIKIPKNIVQTADKIKSEQNFTIIEQDPIIKFSFNRMISGDVSSASFIVDSPVDEELLKTITVETRIDQETLLKKQQDTADALKISRKIEEYDKDGEKYTKITLKLNPKKELTDLSLYEKIPKCLAQRIDDIQMDEQARQMIKVINPDPIVMWQFDKLKSEKEFTYEIKGVIPEDCKKQIIAMGIADELGINLEDRSIFSIILPLLLIPVLGLLIFYINRFTPQKKGNASKMMLSKEEPKAADKQAPADKNKEQPKAEIKPEPKKSFEDSLNDEIDRVTRELRESLK